VRIEEIGAEKAEELNVDPAEGVLIIEVLPNTAAAKAGLRSGDRILKFAGHVVHNPRQLQEYVEQASLGTLQTAEIMRDGNPQSIRVVASPLPKTFGLAGALLRDPKLAVGSTLNDLGIKVADLTKADIKRFGYTGFQGALIKEVEPGGPADQAGIRGGMLVMKVERKEIHSAAEFQASMKNQSLTKGVMLLMRTPDGGNRLIQLRK